MDTGVTAAPAAPVRAGRREWLGLAVLALPTLLLSLDMSVLHLALPHLTADLRPSGSELLWIMDVYGFMIAGFLVTMGTLGDRVGRRRLLMIGGAAFGLASAAAAYAATPALLIAARTVLGVAGATLMPSTLALISNMFRDPRQRGVAIAVWASCFMGGTSIGPVVGGVLLEWFWWGSVFLLGVPVMVLLLVTAPLLLPEHRDPAAGRLDPVSVALSLAAILPVVYGIKESAAHGLSPVPAAAVAAGAVVGAVFVRRQLRLADPLLDLRLFTRRTFSVGLAVSAMGAVAMGGTFLLLSQYLQLVAGLSALEAGLRLVAPSLVMIAGTMLAPGLARRVGTANVIGGGMIVTAFGFLLLTQVDADSGTLLVVAGLAVASLGLGPGAALVADVVVGSAPPAKAGSAASISETAGEFGVALGVALLGSLSTAVYRARITVPDDAPAGTAGAVGDSLAAAVAAAADLPAATAGRLLAPAREAFVLGLTTTAVAGAVLMAVFGVLAIVLLRPAASGAAAAPGPGADAADPRPEPAAP
ncbi:MFS transporter [Streptomonospora nanhaiensis]|uniref:DHA2 family multidrug resistance protein-like MFS transporter n=1 Tax=Streptomonospora nanhaiensis TaxID=1323731 RepID=A0A853BT71_9ACTN|nr:MFS transporter [Streptomonospora nanhaiensis]MBV2367164.1 MFS transporter [Streptomonospora nanhaiensis]MBX9390572.1 MFS transporter [Streptomonospora nanhaiensis]NYI98180.1 DHA2 family multidrug resistance protein-like MFS transporter [Streptomonospora nanhaiensis]